MAKKIGSTYWVHKSNIQELFDIIERVDKGNTYYLNRAKLALSESFANYTVVKYDTKRHVLSLIESPNFDSTFEPWVGCSYIWNLDTFKYRIMSPRKINPQIYHQRYLFVSYDYKGFDVEADFQRRRYYEQFLTKEDVKRIGNYDYWKQFCEKHGIEL